MNKTLNITVNYEKNAPLYFTCRTDIIPKSDTQKKRAREILIKAFHIPNDDDVNKITSIEYSSPVKVMSTGEAKEIKLSEE
jgi:hypothetical protein